MEGHGGKGAWGEQEGACGAVGVHLCSQPQAGLEVGSETTAPASPGQVCHTPGRQSQIWGVGEGKQAQEENKWQEGEGTGVGTGGMWEDTLARAGGGVTRNMGQTACPHSYCFLCHYFPCNTGVGGGEFKTTLQ